MNQFCTSPVSANSKTGEGRDGNHASRESLSLLNDGKLLYQLKSHHLIHLEHTIHRMQS